MIFPALSTSLLGLATLAVAAPHLHSRFEKEVAAREVGPVAERGMVWAPNYRRGNRGNNNVALDITITEFQSSVVDNGRRSNDIALVQEIQQRLIVIDNSQRFKDNVRRNTFRNKNNNVNTVVIVVTQVVDVRDSNNRNTRYLTRQFQSNQNIQDQVIVVVSESQQQTIGGNSFGGNSFGGGIAGPTGVASAADASSTGSSFSFGTYDPSAAAQFSGDFSQSLLPFGAAAPTWPNAQVSVDPAEILLENPQNAAFVSFVGEDNSSNDIVIAIAQ